MRLSAISLLDIYTDYLIASSGPTTATGLAALLPDLSHDQVTRFLSRQELTDADLWRAVKPQLREVQSEEAVLIIDDTVEEKPYTDESELIAWHYDHVVNRTIKGINLLSALYLSADVSLPVAFHLIKKTELFVDSKTGKESWKSKQTKNEIAQEMIASARRKQIPFRYVLADSWFSSTENMVYIKEKAGKDFVIPLKSNRNVFLSDPSAKMGKPTKLSALDFGTDNTLLLYVEQVKFPLLVLRQVFKNEDGKETIQYLSTSDLSLTSTTLPTLYQKRWKVEEYHKSLKSNASFAKSPTKRVRTQSNHFVLSILAFVKLEAIRCANRLNHFALKSKIYLAGLASSYAAVKDIKSVSNLLPYHVPSA
jgi:DDE superfamily endonuclease